jgi:hypothetical protein
VDSLPLLYVQFRIARLNFVHDMVAKHLRSLFYLLYSLPHSGSLSNTEDMRFDRDGNLFFEDDVTAQIGELVLNGDTNHQHPLINEWSIPHGIGFYNIEFDAQGNLWVSDTANFGSGGAVYKLVLEE